MDELELLKKDWKKQEVNLPHYKATELYPMLLKKSSSIVKWIFIISVIELGLGVVLNVFTMDEKFWRDLENLHLKTAIIILYGVSYLITFVFIYYFYKNFKSISATDSASQLMRNILKTRKVVKYYILYILISAGITSLLVFIFVFMYPPAELHVNPDKINWYKVVALGVIITSIILLVIWGIYSLLYGILLKKLKQNYRELKKLEL
ncbi:hypothetical protein [Mesonia maritima]|uniref:Amino acid transporter n=1 Tax=Mesonia maritima TaxID=1793873 RepID=A0ABU1K5H2_9FLAO|nr:hypothetical protein [Mesonia maritima]MDR6300851.1 amino acid transporter [Mesonia maritima]